ncbi:MAG: hypothetical protein ABIJ09_09450 [Pseudomonadota bacterium]
MHRRAHRIALCLGCPLLFGLMASTPGLDLRAVLLAERAKAGRALLAGDLGLVLGADEALRDLRGVFNSVRSRPGIQLVVRFDLGTAVGDRLAQAQCLGARFALVVGSDLRCLDDETAWRQARREAVATQETPWRSGLRTVYLETHHTAIPGVELLFTTADLLALSDLLDASLRVGSPFVYAQQARRQRPWLRRFDADFERAVPAFCPQDATARHWMLQGAFARSLSRRHSYMQVEEYLRKRQWERELARLGQYLSLHAGRPVALHETLLCIASQTHDKSWALFDIGLLLDIALYEAQAVRRDPLGVLSVAALTARQQILALAFARALDGLLLQVPGPGPVLATEDRVQATLGAALPLVHDVVFLGETLGYDSNTRAAAWQALYWLQPRQADQPVFASELIRLADPALGCLAPAIYGAICTDCAPAPVDASCGASHDQVGVVPGQRLPDLVGAHPALVEQTLQILGGYASNRFYALYDLAPALIDDGRLDLVAPLFFWGAMIHFELQRADMRSLKQWGHHISVDANTALRREPPLLKSYHYWTEAWIACRLARQGVGQDAVLGASRIVGRHYRRLMTPMYLSYQAFHDGDLGLVFDENEAAITLHQQGADFGYMICHRDHEP